MDMKVTGAFRDPLERVIPDGVLIQVGPPDDEHLLLETCRGVEINTLRKSASSWSLTIILYCTYHYVKNAKINIYITIVPNKFTHNRK